MRSTRLGRYELLEELRQDDDGVVYKASDPLLGRLLAIKTVERGRDAAAAALDFERKGKLAAGLTHPNIVSVYDAGTSRDVAYIATELVEGRTLRELLDSGTTLAPAAIERIAAQIADALDFMHRHGIVHGDVRPSTIEVLDIGFAKLSCLGRALLPMDASMAHGPVGAPSPYVSPEHVVNGSLDARSDVFSLGAVLYEMLTGVAPFSGHSPDELAHAIAHEHPHPPSTLNADIPSGFDYVVARALSKEPDHRYPSGGEMASHLRRWALEEPTFFALPRAGEALPAPVPEVLPERAAEPRESLRTRRQWLLYGVPGALLLMGTGWALWSRPSATAKSSETVASVTPSTSAPRAPQTTAPSVAAAQAVHGPEVPPPSVTKETVSPAVDPAPAADAASIRTETRPMARVKLAVSPWGEIYVDGHRRGVSPPLRQIDLVPGKHRIEIRNASFPPRRESVDVKPNGHVRIKHKFL